MNFQNILENLGYKLSDHGSYWRTNALYRAGDNTTALQIYKDSGVWKDYVEDSIFLPFEALVQKTMKTSDVKSVLKGLKTVDSSVKTEKNLLKEEIF